jgi:hypothetical protein
MVVHADEAAAFAAQAIVDGPELVAPAGEAIFLVQRHARAVLAHVEDVEGARIPEGGAAHAHMPALVYVGRHAGCRQDADLRQCRHGLRRPRRTGLAVGAQARDSEDSADVLGARALAAHELGDPFEPAGLRKIF